MACGNVMKSYTPIMILSTPLALTIIVMIGSMLMSPGTCFTYNIYRSIYHTIFVSNVLYLAFQEYRKGKVCRNHLANSI